VAEVCVILSKAYETTECSVIKKCLRKHSFSACLGMRVCVCFMLRRPTCMHLSYFVDVQVIMLERLVEQREAVSLMLSDVKNLNSHQWVTVRDLVTTLRPFMDVTVLMSAASYPTLSMILPVLDGLKHSLETASGGLDGLRSILLRLLGDKFGDVFGDDELCVATVVDPRFKLVPFDTDDRKRHQLFFYMRCRTLLLRSNQLP